ncbi:recombinase family protein [Streptomyces plumbiresistens]|uniref:Resolvase/invertase-type recombinase catalytic domain-containing protein n=1 Tax=Streptomyces plumbiresistens TaxID=511811 RepID=A0ABP7SSR1_9ACTN
MTATTVQIATDVATRTAREYLRVSKGRGRTARSITDQHTENLTAELEHGPWTWGEPYKDTGSASKYARKVRDDFEKMLADLQSGAFGKPGDVLVLWEISRLARETGRGVALIDACEAGGYLIHITSHERTYNPANYQDRHSLISGINDAEKEARLLSARTLRGLNSAAREGRPQGQVSFGYRRDYQVVDGRPRPVAQYPDPAEGPLIAELFVRVAGAPDNQLGDESVPLLYTHPDGEGALPEPMYAIAKDWEERGIVSRDRMVNGELVPGKPFTPQNLRSMLLRPAYAAFRKHNGVLIPEQWEGWTAIISLELFDLVQTILSDPSRRTYTGEHIQHVLSMTIKCDVCGAGMVVVTRRKKGTKDAVGYQCGAKGHTWVPKDETDRLLIGDLEPTDPETGEPLPPELGVILAYLSAPHRHAALSRPADTSPQERQTRAELLRIRGELAELESAPRPKTARARLARTADMEELEQDIAALEAKLSALTAPNPLASVLPSDPGTDLIAWWKAADVQRQRAVAGLLLTPGLLGQVRVVPSPVKRNAAPVTERIKWVTAA